MHQCTKFGPDIVYTSFKEPELSQSLLEIYFGLYITHANITAGEVSNNQEEHQCGDLAPQLARPKQLAKTE